MRILKALANSMLSLLLFLCLSVMGVAITLNATALNSGFVTKQIDKLDVVALFNEKALPELQKDEQLAAHPQVIAAIQNAVTHNAPALKAAGNKAVSDIYAYLVHGGTLDLRRTLKSSILDPALAISILNDIDFSTVVHDLLAESLPPEGVVIAGANIDPTPYIDAVVPVIEPWFKEQVKLVIPKLYDFVLGDSTTLDLNIPLGPVVDDIRGALKSAILASPPAPIAGMSQAELSLDFDTAWAQTLPQLPVAFEISQPGGFENSEEIAQGFKDAEKGLADARKGIVYYREAFWSLAGLTALLVLIIILVNRDVKAICRILGGVLASYGIIEATGIVIGRGLAHSRLPTITDVPHSLQPWLAQFIDAFTNPLLIFALCCAALGIALFVISFFYHRKQEPPKTSETA